MFGMKAKGVLAAALVTAVSAPLTMRCARAAEPWAPTAQDLKAVLAQARPVTVEDVCQPVKSAVFFPGNITWAPNPDGKTYDVIIPYERQYGGPPSGETVHGDGPSHPRVSPAPGRTPSRFGVRRRAFGVRAVLGRPVLQLALLSAGET
jgi:hypothetical protein